MASVLALRSISFKYKREISASSRFWGSVDALVHFLAMQIGERSAQGFGVSDNLDWSEVGRILSEPGLADGGTQPLVRLADNMST